MKFALSLESCEVWKTRGAKSLIEIPDCVYFQATKIEEAEQEDDEAELSSSRFRKCRRRKSSLTDRRKNNDVGDADWDSDSGNDDAKNASFKRSTTKQVRRKNALSRLDFASNLNQSYCQWQHLTRNFFGPRRPYFGQLSPLSAQLRLFLLALTSNNFRSVGSKFFGAVKKVPT